MTRFSIRKARLVDAAALLAWLGLTACGNADAGAATDGDSASAAGAMGAMGGAGAVAGSSAAGGSLATEHAGHAGAAGAAGHAGAAADPMADDDAGVAAPASDGGASGANGGAGGSAPAAGAGGSAGGAQAPVKPPCLKKDSELVVVGDSYLNWITHNFPDDFTQALGRDYRMYAEPGASMANGGIATLIPDQLANAIADDSDIIASVMTGGGNDILIADTTKFPGSDECKDRADSPMVKVCQDVIAAAISTAAELMQTAADAGIRDVIYIYYPHVPGGGFAGMNPNAILDYSLPMARDLCDQAESSTNGRLRCHFLDLQPVFAGHSDWFADDGIHENATGSAAIAEQVVQMMKDECIAQPADSGCCMP